MLSHQLPWQLGQSLQHPRCDNLAEFLSRSGEETCPGGVAIKKVASELRFSLVNGFAPDETWHLFSIYYAQGLVMCSFHALGQLIFIATPGGGWYYYPILEPRKLRLRGLNLPKVT